MWKRTKDSPFGVKGIEFRAYSSKLGIQASTFSWAEIHPCGRFQEVGGHQDR
jgi:hypothetical protein